MILRPSEARAGQRRSAAIILFTALLTMLAIVAASLLAANAQAANQIRNSKSEIRNPEVLAWRLVPAVTGANLRDVHMVSATDGWAVGENGTVLRYNGTSWSAVNINPQPANETLVDVYMLSANDGYIGGWGESGASGTIYRWNGTSWGLVYNAARDINRIDAVAPNDVWASGVGQIYHYDGTSWTLSYNEPNGRNIFAIQMLSATEGWAVGANQLIAHYLNGSWTPLKPSPAPQTLYDSFFTAPNDGWAVGFTDSTYVMHYDGVEWTRAYSPTAQLSRMYFLSATDGWAVSYSSILHFDGTGFTEVNNPYPDGLSSVYMLTPTDGWIVGTNGAMLHYSDDATATPTVEATATGTETPVQATTTSTPQATVTSAPATNTPVAPTATPSPCTIEFTDVPTTNTFYIQVRCLACRGIMGGYSDGTFRPNNDITRGQLSKIVANSAGFNEPVTGQTFEDVEPDNTFYVYIERMAGRGIIGGYNCGGAGEPCIPPGDRPYFRPNANATRGQISKIVSEAKGYSDPQAGQTFQDVAVGSTFHLWIERLASRGIMGGYACGGAGEPCVPPGDKPYFRPNAKATRGQTSKIVANTFFPGCQP